MATDGVCGDSIELASSSWIFIIDVYLYPTDALLVVSFILIWTFGLYDSIF